MTDLVRVWIVALDVPPATAARCAEVLDDGERARAAALAGPRERRRFTVAHGALRILAARAAGASPADLAWTAGPHGKPELAPPWSWLHTSLSHSGSLMAAAVSAGRPVGVDIQQLLPGPRAARLSARFFPPGEAAYVAAGRDPGEQADRFACLWARKEAAVKAAGGRLWPNLKIAVRDRDVVACAGRDGALRVADVPAPAGFRGAVALTGDGWFGLNIARWPGPDITGPSPPPRSPCAAVPGSAAAPGQARARTAAPRRPGG